jgi:gentisate 1,2-dioxygenase
MNAPHAIAYRSRPEPSHATPAAERATYLSERDFGAAALPRPIEQALPLAAPAPEDGVLDFSRELGLSWPATLPALLAGTRSLAAGTQAPLAEHAGSAIVLVLSGSGLIAAGDEQITVGAGDILAVPGRQAFARAGAEGLRLYFVDDSPMARYMGWRVDPDARCPLVHWPAAALAAKLDETAAQGITASGVFLSHAGLAREKLASPNLFAHLNRLMPGAANTVHAHAAAAITYVIEANERSYSLLGPQLDGPNIVNPQRVDWHAGQVSLTPPNLWHGHYNDGDTPILSLVVQLSGVYYNDRTMNFLFAG